MNSIANTKARIDFRSLAEDDIREIARLALYHLSKKCLFDLLDHNLPDTMKEELARSWEIAKDE